MRAYRRPAIRIICLIWLPLALWMGYLASTSATRTPGTGERVPTPPGQRIVYGVLFLGFAALTARSWRVGVYAGPEGIRVQNTLRTHRIPWARVEGFGSGQYRGPGAFPVGALRLTDGRTISAFALNPPLGHDTLVAGLVAQLNEEVRRRRDDDEVAGG